MRRTFPQGKEAIKNKKNKKIKKTSNILLLTC